MKVYINTYDNEEADRIVYDVGSTLEAAEIQATRILHGEAYIDIFEVEVDSSIFTFMKRIDIQTNL